MRDHANAYPKKSFFIDMFTRDISFEDCILDLIDNSFDALILSKKIDLFTDIGVFSSAKKYTSRKKLPFIKVSFSEDQVKIEDNCGGIDQKDAQDGVFNFGRDPSSKRSTIGVYGIGLKRAIFKIGNRFQIVSKTKKGGFSIDLDLKEWVKNDQNIEDWRMPIKYIQGVNSSENAGTTITISNLHPAIKMRIKDRTLEDELASAISQTYAFFLQNLAHLELNKNIIEPKLVQIADSKDVSVAHEAFSHGVVHVHLYAGLAELRNDEWSAKTAGWYVLCNGRTIVRANQDTLTGWGNGLPSWHTKYRGFLGIAIFSSKSSELLPWTTTKRDLNRESPIYLHTLNRMIGISKPVIKFCNDMYKSEPITSQPEREIVKDIKPIEIQKLGLKPVASFTTKTKTIKSTTQRIQYDAEREQIKRIRKHIMKSGISLEKIGLLTFNYYLENECSD